MKLPPRFLLDEHLRGPLHDAIRSHNSVPDADPLLADRVGDFADLPLGSDDPSILRWAEREGWILVTGDRRTMATHLRDHLARGGHSPGVFLLPSVFSIAEVIEALILAAYVADPSEWVDRVAYLPSLA